MLNDEKIQESILDGTFDCNPYPKALRLYLKSLEQKKQPKQLKLAYSFHEFRSFIKNSKEKNLLITERPSLWPLYRSELTSS